MPSWMYILCIALAGGLIVLNGFSKTKESSEAMLDAYKQMLQDSLENDDDDDNEEEHDEEHDEDATSESDEEESGSAESQ